MFLLHARDSWSYRQGGDPAVDFCLWVLEVDGLRVPPFDQHPDGDGSLRALGLTADDWQTWFLRTLDPAQSKQDVERLRQRYLAEYLTTSGEPDLEHLQRRLRAERLTRSTDAALPPPPAFSHHQASWMGSIVINNKLIELEQRYRQIVGQRDRWREDVERSLHREGLKAPTRLYDDLRPYHHRLPSLNSCLATYDAPLDYLSAPATLLITIQAGQPVWPEFRERVAAAVAELAAQADRRRRRFVSTRETQGVYTRIGGSADRTIAYRRHMRTALPPPLAKPEAPRLDDPLRQLIIADLWDERSGWLFGSVDPATIRFVREKQRPGWRLYELTFAELDGEDHRMTFILQQRDDGSWRSKSGGTRSNLQNDWSRIMAPVRDHPLLFLGTLGFTVNHRQCVEIAHGDVIDNGFHVERVRLVNDAGQALEDVVEEGYVFFAFAREEQVQLPMQAQLYDREGTLVWRQMIPDHGLPPWLKFRRQR
jgi:hypothetical protein